MKSTKLSHSAAMVLQAVQCGSGYGFHIMELTGLPSGTVYPAVRRLEQEGLVASRWEKPSVAEAEGRPPRKYYRLTRSGEAVLEVSRGRYPLLARLGRDA